MFFNFFKKRRLSPIFIVGAPRSGTTWLWGLLTSHPNTIPLVREDFDPSNPSVVDEKRKTSETGAFINYKKDFILKTVKKKQKKFPNKKLVEKTPLHILHIKEILELFPESKIICILRDPRAVISSMLNSNFYKFANSLNDAINQYRVYINAFLPFEKNPNIHIVKYEKLLENTDKELNKIFQFISLPTENIAQIIEENKNKVKGDIHGVFRKGTIDSYKKDLTKEQINFIEKELEDLINYLGF